jgi:hypothetical protein
MIPEKHVKTIILTLIGAISTETKSAVKVPKNVITKISGSCARCVVG